MTFAATVYTAPKAPTECPVCGRKGSALEAFTDGRRECSHVECPNRRIATAAPSAPSRFPRDPENDE